MCTKAQLHTILQAVYKQSVTMFGSALDAVILFGSYARGDYDEESDIDVMVRAKLDKAQLEKCQWQMSVFTSRLGLEHNILVSVHLQDTATFEQYKNDMPFFQSVIKDGVQIGA